MNESVTISLANFSPQLMIEIIPPTSSGTGKVKMKIWFYMPNLFCLICSKLAIKTPDKEYQMFLQKN